MPKISELPVSGAVTQAEEIPAVQAGGTVKVALSAILGVYKKAVDITAEIAAAIAPFKTQPEIETIIREFNTTVDHAVTGHTPTKAECIAVFKTLPHFDWAKDDNFNIRDTTGPSKLFNILYRANGDTTEAGANYMFWYQEMKAAA